MKRLFRYFFGYGVPEPDASPGTGNYACWKWSRKLQSYYPSHCPPIR